MNFRLKVKDQNGEDVYLKPEFYVKVVDGVEQLAKNDDRGEALTLEFFVVSALFALADKIDERGNHVLDGPSRMEVYELCKKLRAPSKEKDLSRSELERIKDATGKYLSSTHVMGQIWELIEKELVDKKDK